MKKIAKLLKADINATSDLAEIAKMLQGKGRGRDTILAHITPREAEILKAAGGSGSTNPETGLLEFQEIDVPSGGDIQPVTEQFGDFQPGGQTPQEVAAANPDLYPSGQLPSEPYSNTVFYPTNLIGAARPTATSEDFLNQYTKDTTAPGDVSAPPRQPTAREAFELGRVAQPSPAPEKFEFLDKLTKGLTTQDMIRLGLAGGLGTVGAVQARKGAKQAEAAAAEQRAVGAPYQAKGQELIRAAEAGELTPTSQASLQALQARLAQGVESRGGVGAQQAAAQAEQYRQQLLSQQYNLGLQVSNIGDQIALGAIRTGLQADQALNQASTAFYTQLAAIGAGIPMYDTRTGTRTA